MERQQAPTQSAIRHRRWRHRRRNALVPITIDVDVNLIEALKTAGLLQSDKEDDREAITAALTRAVEAFVWENTF